MNGKPQKQKRVYRRKRTNPKKSYKMIKKVVSSMAETKNYSLSEVNQSCGTWGSAMLGKYLILAPNITQNTTIHGRIGNQIEVKSGVLTGYINLLPYNLTTNPFPNIKVKLFLVSYRNKNTNFNENTTLVLNEMQEFLNDGGSTGVPFQGNTLDLLYPVNESKWKVHKQKVISLSLNATTTDYPIGTAPSDNGGRYQQFFKFYIGKYLGKLLYNDTVGGSTARPVNKNLFLIVQPVRADGTYSAAIIPCELHYNLNIKYKDI